MIWFNTASFSYPFVGNDAAKFESCPSKRSCVSCAKIVRRGSCDVSVRNPVCKHDASHVPVVRHPYHFVASAFPLITARWNSERRFGFPPDRPLSASQRPQQLLLTRQARHRPERDVLHHGVSRRGLEVWLAHRGTCCRVMLRVHVSEAAELERDRCWPDASTGAFVNLCISLLELVLWIDFLDIKWPVIQWA